MNGPGRLDSLIPDSQRSAADQQRLVETDALNHEVLVKQMEGETFEKATEGLSPDEKENLTQFRGRSLDLRKYQIRPGTPEWDAAIAEDDAKYGG